MPSSRKMPIPVRVNSSACWRTPCTAACDGCQDSISHPVSRTPVTPVSAVWGSTAVSSELRPSRLLLTTVMMGMAIPEAAASAMSLMASDGF